VPTFLVIHETQNAGKFVKAEVPGFPLTATVFIGDVPVREEAETIPCFEVYFAGGASNW
jgi:hypothetical protein